MKQEHISEIKAIIILAIGIILLASLFSFVPEDLPWLSSHPNIPARNLIGRTGAYSAGILFFIFGYSAYTLVLLLFFWSWNKFTLRELEFSFSKFLSLIILIIVGSSLLSMLGPQEHVFRFERAGLIGSFVADFLVRYLGSTGAYIILLTLGALALIITGEFLVTPLMLLGVQKLQSIIHLWQANIEKKKLIQAQMKPKAPIVSLKADFKKNIEKTVENFEDTTDDMEEAEIKQNIKKKTDKPKIKIAPTSTNKEKESVEEPKIVGEYHLPSLDLLEDPPEISSSKIQDNLMNGAKLLEETLANFGVMAKVADIERGPAITRYELEPAPGVKVQKFTTLQDDIALAMRAPTVRIVAPIPGKNRIGVEVPNSDSSFVYLKDVLSSEEYRKSAQKSKLTLALGKDI
ncbi:MAG TPA: DNA translocase FtsK 4TM domain-containing protein, partial [Candidatus Omnitrophota bacterium]|nr:DNA translocase FtsK 4TM domain-containing protein [Candidatus Omnitrophota bacterium]